MKLNASLAAGIIWLISNVTFAQSVVVDNDIVSQSGGISEASSSTTSTQLNYQVCNSTNSDQQALLKIDIIGNGPNQVPLGSTILDAKLRLRAQIGGDGLLYRAGEQWDATPTWGEVGGDVLPAGTFIAVGRNTGQSIDVPVTEHVQLWANGTTSNQGWVIKGDFNNDDCAAARMYNGSAGVDDRPRLRVIYDAPGGGDATKPTIMDVDVGSTTSPHADYDVPDGSGEQLRTIPLAKINQFFVKFSEHVTGVTDSKFDFYNVTTQSVYTGTVSYNSATFVATFTLDSEVSAHGQFVLHVRNVIEDTSGNNLDGAWTNPTHVDDAESDMFPSGVGGLGEGPLSMYLTVLRADFNRDNVVDSADRERWDTNFGMTGASFDDGDANGDGDVNGFDLTI
jgi:hypothetical protein